ncbi:MAG: hypothetical protein AAB525_02400 [Patescibacteria group bacterium]
MKKDYPQPAQSQKIPFWRRRWFWRAVLGMISLGIIVFLFYFFAGENRFILLPSGFLVAIEIIIFSLIPALIKIENNIFPDFWKVSKTLFNALYVTIYCLLYYGILIFLLSKTCQHPKIKFKYLIITILIIAMSIAGLFMLANFYS